MTDARGAAEEQRWLDPRCTVLPTDRLGPFVVLGDGNLLTVDQHCTVISDDDGRSWSEPRPIGEAAAGERGGGVLLRTGEGVLIYVYMDMGTYHWEWDSATKEASEDARLDVYAIRSLDEGQTWVDDQRLLAGYCGALVDIIETRSGHIVVPVQELVREPSRHATRTCVSKDGGRTWERSNLIDLGGHGHHDGAMEATVAELQDGRLWMLLRTNWDRFWEAFSTDNGLSWRVIQPTEIDASSAPGSLKRLASGRLALVWNRLYPEGRTDYPRRGGDDELCREPASFHRDELSIALSEDDGRTWTPPAVLARDPGGLSYPHVLERRPGELWITTMFQGELRVSLREADFAD
ncbi:MAG: sialidase family protein [Armatimonadota bacterium]|jgi:sialidase-1